RDGPRRRPPGRAPSRGPCDRRTASTAVAPSSDAPSILGWLVRHGLAVCGRGRGDPEAARLVQVERLVRVLGVDAERRARQPMLPEQEQAADDERASQAAPPPRTAGEDGVEPALGRPTVDPAVDAVEDRSGDLVAVEADEPEARIGA